jgi:hypothetical protein
MNKFGCAHFVAFSALLISCSSGPLAYTMGKKPSLLALVHIGMTRSDLYAGARAMDLRPSNPNHVRFGKSGPPVDNGEFPKPSASDPHPFVEFYLLAKPVGCSIPTFHRVITFNSRDCVKTIKDETIQTGACL